MHVLYVIHYPVFGGVHNCARSLAASLPPGDRLTVALPDESGNAASMLRQADVDVVQVRLRRMRQSRDPVLQARFAWSLVADSLRLARLMRALSVEVVVIGGLVNPHAGLAARALGIPVVWQVVDTRPPATVRRASFAIARRLADTLMFNGRRLLSLHAGESTDPVPAVVFASPVDTERFVVPSTERRAEVRSRLGIPYEVPLVVTVANVNPQKGIEYFLRAARLVHLARPEAYFVVSGHRYDTHPDYDELLKRESQATGIPTEQLLWHAEDPLEVYQAADVKLITSVPRSEGTTTTAMEALACGVPVVATDVGAVAEIVADGECGRVVPPINPSALAGATLELLEDPALRARYGAEGRRRATELYDVREFAARHREAFAAALHHRQGSRRRALR